MRLSRICVILLACLLPASAILAQASSQHDCRKEPAGGTPAWANTSKSTNKMKTLVWTGKSWTADHVKTYCLLLIQVCGETVVNRLNEDESTEVAPGTNCHSSADYAAPWVNCDAWQSETNLRCNSISKDVSHERYIQCELQNPEDPMNVQRKPQGNRGMLYINVPTGHERTYQDPSTDSPVINAVYPHGSRAVFTDVKDVSGTIWYYVGRPGGIPGWIPGDEISCSPTPPIPPGRFVTPKELDLLDVHPDASLTSASAG